MNKMLDLYSDYLIAQNQYATAIGLSDLLEGRISHDKITKFLNGQEFSSKELCWTLSIYESNLNICAVAALPSKCQDSTRE